jgi:hypothetical protein
VSKEAQGAQVMSVPTKSTISVPPPPGAQRKNVGALCVLLADDGVALVPVPNEPEGAPSEELAAPPIPVVPVPVVEGARAVGWMLVTLTLGGVANRMMLVVGLDGEKAGAGATLAAGPALVAAVAGLVAVDVVAVVPVVEVVLEPGGGGGVVGSGIAPDTDSGGVPGGGARALTVVDVVVDVEVGVDCASAGLAAPRSSAVASASLTSLIAICHSLEKHTEQKNGRTPSRSRTERDRAWGIFAAGNRRFRWGGKSYRRPGEISDTIT